MDLLYPESARYAPLALRLVKLSDKNGEQELLSIPPQMYESGTLTQAFKFDSVGQYALYLDDKRATGTEFKLQIPIKVGTDWKDYAARYWPQALVFLFIVIVLSNWKRIFG